MHPGDEVDGFYILRSAALKTAAARKPFMTAVFSDRGGTIEGKLWDYTGPIGPADAGKVIKLRGTVGEYRGTPQITVGRLRLAAPEERGQGQQLGLGLGDEGMAQEQGKPAGACMKLIDQGLDPGQKLLRTVTVEGLLRLPEQGQKRLGLCFLIQDRRGAQGGQQKQQGERNQHPFHRASSFGMMV